MSEQGAITAISVTGFKSIAYKREIAIRPLTILAGANSSGKSSIMQPLLLMKQTLEAPYDPGTFLLDGPNVRFTSPTQFMLLVEDQSSHKVEIDTSDAKLFSFYIGLSLGKQESVELIYLHAARSRLTNEKSLIMPVQLMYMSGEVTNVLRIRDTHEQIAQRFGDEIEAFRETIQNFAKGNFAWKALRNRCFLNIGMENTQDGSLVDFGELSVTALPIFRFRHAILDIIHIPGLRGNPERSYQVASVEDNQFSGTFEHYAASLIYRWQTNADERITQLAEWLRRLGLTSEIAAQSGNAVSIELQVARTISDENTEMVSIADVGFGVSQVLPVLVALLAAKPGQLVYIEQPELHLHPRAQVALAGILADAANRGVRVVIETHSSLLLTGVQTLIAKGDLSPDDVILHWFQRNEEGFTEISSVQPDENGAYGDWPEDFDDVQFGASQRYIDAVTERELSKRNGKG